MCMETSGHSLVSFLLRPCSPCFLRTRKSPTRPDRLARKPPRLLLPAALTPMLDYCTPAFTWVLGGGR